MPVLFYGLWESYPGNQLYSLALPDYYSTYLSYTINFNQYPNTGLKITGQFPKARYMSFNIYSTSAGTSLHALTDFQIETSNHSANNPFIAGSTAAPGSQYVINVEPKVGSSDAPNTLYFDLSELPNGELTVVIRYYVPEVDDYGDQPPPQIQVYNLSDRRFLNPTPAGVLTDMDLNEETYAKRLAPIFMTASHPKLGFYHSGGGGLFNNADNVYLIAAVKDVDFNEYCVALRVQAPAFPQSNQQFDQVPVRYWSFNQGNPNTSTPNGKHDAQLLPAPDGYVYIVMGKEILRATAEQNNYNYMQWSVSDPLKGVILYRNMLTIPQYRGSIDRVPQLPNPPWPLLDEYEASLFIGDYAPAGQIVLNTTFIDSPQSIFN